MKRTALRRVTGLSRSTALRPRSRKMTRVYVDRRAFVADFLRGRFCEGVNYHIPEFGNSCFGELTVHESIARSQSGSILPDAKAEAQGQTFHALCQGHHSWITDHPAWAVEHGFTQRRRAG